MTASTWPLRTRTPSKISGWLTTSKRVCACGRAVEAGKDLKKARHRAQAGNHQLLAGDDRGCGAQVGIDGQVGGGVAGGLVFHQGLLQQCVDAAALPVHFAVPFGNTASSCQLLSC